MRGLWFTQGGDGRWGDEVYTLLRVTPQVEELWIFPSCFSPTHVLRLSLLCQYAPRECCVSLSRQNVAHLFRAELRVLAVAAFEVEESEISSLCIGGTLAYLQNLSMGHAPTSQAFADVLAALHLPQLTSLSIGTSESTIIDFKASLDKEITALAPQLDTFALMRSESSAADLASFQLWKSMTSLKRLVVDQIDMVPLVLKQIPSQLHALRRDDFNQDGSLIMSYTPDIEMLKSHPNVFKSVKVFSIPLYNLGDYEEEENQQEDDLDDPRQITAKLGVDLLVRPLECDARGVCKLWEEMVFFECGTLVCFNASASTGSALTIVRARMDKHDDKDED